VRVSGVVDPEIVIRVPLSVLQTVVRHLHLGLYLGNPVHEIVKTITDQANAQILAAATMTAAASNPIALPDRLN
jgi:hypothetical protein